MYKTYSIYFVLGILLLGVSGAPAGIRERDCIPSPDCHRSGPICVIDEYGATRTFEHQCMADLASCRKGTYYAEVKPGVC
ncbi:hypothetical protein QE152_g26060 [Popillia japonica]|uniref:Uncharacterized protein n=1 Tax=Popillia japonica TaxID=7064 RepID=A0AAW1K0P4_POPJA